MKVFPQKKKKKKKNKKIWNIVLVLVIDFIGELRRIESVMGVEFHHFFANCFLTISGLINTQSHPCLFDSFPSFLKNPSLQSITIIYVSIYDLII